MTPPSVADNEVKRVASLVMAILWRREQYNGVGPDYENYRESMGGRVASYEKEAAEIARAALAAFDRDGKWQPIETAPRDGTKIDVWVRCFSVEDAGKVSCEDRGRYPDVYWGKQVEIYTGPYERRESDGEGWVYRDDLHWLFIESGDYRVTHWMPLPLPPSDALQTGERATSPDPVSPPSTQP